MPRQCTICIHPERGAVELAVATGESYRSVADRYEGVSKQALARHIKNGHLTSVVLGPTFQPEILEGSDILAEMSRLRENARVIGVKADLEGNLTVALQAIREQSRIIELLVKLAALLKDSGKDNIVNEPEWWTLRGIIVEALKPYPDALDAVVDALKD